MMYRHYTPNGNNTTIRHLRQRLKLSISYKVELGLVYQGNHNITT